MSCIAVFRRLSGWARGVPLRHGTLWAARSPKTGFRWSKRILKSILVMELGCMDMDKGSELIRMDIIFIYVYIHTYIHKPDVVYFENIAGLFTCRFLNLDHFLSKKSSCLASWYDPWFKVERFPREAHETGCLTSKADGWGLVRYKVAWPASWHFWWSQLPNFNCSQSLPARE